MRNILRTIYRRYLIDAMAPWRWAVFFADYRPDISWRISLLAELKAYADVVSASSPVVGAAIGVAIAARLKAEKLALFSSAVAGAVGYSMSNVMGAYFAAVVGANWVSWFTAR